MCLRVSLELHLCAVVMLVCNSACGSWCPIETLNIYFFFGSLFLYLFHVCVLDKQNTIMCVYKPHFLIYILLSLQTGFLFGKT